MSCQLVTQISCLAGVSKEEASTLVLRGKKLAALGMRVLTAPTVIAQHRHTPTLQHATQEAMVSCIQALTGSHANPTCFDSSSRAREAKKDNALIHVEQIRQAGWVGLSPEEQHGENVVISRSGHITYLY